MIDMELNELIEDMPTSLQAGLIGVQRKKDHLYIEIKKDHLPGFASYVHRKYHTWLISEHAVDLGPGAGKIQLYVVFSLAKTDGYVTLWTEIDRAFPTYHSITPEVYAANWFEREIKDMFGMVPNGHPDQRPLVLYDDWPYGSYPLLKDFQVPEGGVPRERTEYIYRRVEGEGIFEIPVGPIHAGVIEPGHFRFSVAGEPIHNLEIRMGYVHKGIEKMSESTSYDRGVLLSERISGDNGFTHSLAYCQAVESAAEVMVPERALYLRTVFSEMERLYNHFGDVGGIALDTAFTVGAQMAYLMRERMMDLNEKVTGSRFLRSVNCIGGVRKDVDRDQRATIASTLIQMSLDFNDFCETVTRMPSLLDRVETTGILSNEAARNLNIVGPGGRGSGIDRDVRRDHPYAAYKNLSFAVPVYREGDVYARMRVKMDEIKESISLIDQALDKAPAGPINTAPGRIPSDEIGMSLVETHRGEAMHWVLTGEGRPYRHKIRDPSFFNWLAMEVAVLGNIVPDFPLVNKSFNLSYAGNDL